jgi:uncharacterized protein (UPF0332 family)
MSDFAVVEWERAGNALESAKLLLESDADASASRAYYAAFHAVTALFALEGRKFKKHSAVRSAVHRDLVHEGRFTPELGDDFDLLMDLREQGDYGGISRVSSEDARVAVEKAAGILEAVRRACPGLQEGAS